MIGVSRQGNPFPLNLPVLLIFVSSILLIDLSNGQPNYYYKPSAPVKSLPRIGRRSEDISGNEPLLSSIGGGGLGGGNSISLARSLDSPGILDMWSNSGGGESSFGGDLGSAGRTSSFTILGTSGLSPSLITPLSQSVSLDKSLLWRKLLGDINNYEESLLENMYRTKS